jgi:hypothetical protein
MNNVHPLLIKFADHVEERQMPDDRLIYQYARAAAPEFTEHVIQAFAFLETAYGYRLQERCIDTNEDARDTQARVTYASERVAVSLAWFLADAAISVSFIQLAQPYTMPSRAVFFGETHGAARAFTLYTLAEMLGHADDPDFVLGDADRVDGRSVNKRSKLLQTNLPGIIQGLAQASERYARDILRGETSVFPAVMRYNAQKMQSLGYWIP